MNTFEEFLEEKYDELDNASNNMNEAFENRRNSWFENLDAEELIKYGQEYGKYVEYTTVEDIQNKLIVQTLRLHDELKSFKS